MISATNVRPLPFRVRDLLSVASLGLRTRVIRALLSGLGIAIGVGSVVGVLGISAASEADLLYQIGQLSNLVLVKPGQDFGTGNTAKLPVTAPSMINRINQIQGVTSLGTLQDLKVHRSDLESVAVTRGIAVSTTQTNLLTVLNGSMRTGVFLNAATDRYPAVVLGATAAQRLGIDQTGQRVLIARRWFTVVGILNQFLAQPDLDQTALIGYPEAAAEFQYDGAPSIIYVRTDPDNVAQVVKVLAAMANPENPQSVAVYQPSDSLKSQAIAKSTFTQLYLALGGVSLLVGGVMIANVMLTAVLERRTEIGLRRALGATKGDIATQFLGEAIMLSGLGGLAGIAVGMLITFGYGQLGSLPFVVPVAPIIESLAVAVLTGAVAGFYPALRAARLDPTEALGSV
jgi:putative ABC transport system permease protein